jgi:hypothetical protein
MSNRGPREDRKNETSSFDQCGGGRRARIFGTRLGATGKSVRWERHGYARPEPRRTGTDTVQLGPEPRRIGAIGSAHGAFGADGSLRDAAVFDVRYQFGDAAKAPPGLTPRLARQTIASPQPVLEPAGQCRKSVEPGRAAAAAGGELSAASAPGHDAPWAAGWRAYDPSRDRAIAFSSPES